jgi:tetratricopeptide (TPR) repeat protein
MPRKIKVNKKKVLKQPDEFISFSSKIFSFIKTYQKQVLIILPIVAIIIIVISLSSYYINLNNKNAFIALSKILETEKDIQKKKAGLLSIRQKKLTEASKYAAFYLASLYLFENDKENAKKELEYAISIKNSYFKGASTSMLVDILTSEKKYDDATKLIDKNTNLPTPFKEELLFKKAQILETTNKIQEAKAIYKQIEKDYPNFYLIKLVQAKK